MASGKTNELVWFSRTHKPGYHCEERDQKVRDRSLRGRQRRLARKAAQRAARRES